MSLNCDSYKVAVIWAIIAHEIDDLLNRNLRLMKRMTRSLMAALAVTLLLSSLPAFAETAAVIDARVDASIQTFKEDINGADVFLSQSAGYLVFPRVIKVGLGFGAESGEGALRVRGRTVEYYRTTAGSFGLQLGAQAKAIVIAFMTPESLQKFRNSSGWKVGVDGSVALIDLGAGKAIDTGNVKDPVVGFIFDAKGLMYNLTLEGTKISKLNK
jgi:lipid-binding SYLF domain-containing protein